MLTIVRNLLEKILNDIDTGNSNITEDEEKQIIDVLTSITEPRLSKYQAMQYLNVSRATFDNLVKEGKLPQGTRQAGFKEKFWKKSEILQYITKDK
jgi:predicted DNA-binding transcriptional regulator AlpA